MSEDRELLTYTNIRTSVTQEIAYQKTKNSYLQLRHNYASRLNKCSSHVSI